MFGVEEVAFLQKVARKMEDCGVYKLHVRSESTQVHQYGPKIHFFLNMAFEADPRLQLVFPPDTEWSLTTWLSRARINTKFSNDSDAIGNLFKATFIAVDCGGTPVPTCPNLDGAFHYG
jgi:hypothetical protein